MESRGEHTLAKRRACSRGIHHSELLQWCHGTGNGHRQWDKWIHQLANVQRACSWHIAWCKGSYFLSLSSPDFPALMASILSSSSSTLCVCMCACVCMCMCACVCVSLCYCWNAARCLPCKTLGHVLCNTKGSSVMWLIWYVKWHLWTPTNWQLQMTK